MRRVLFFCTFAVVVAAIFARLGVWQLHRLGERKAENALVRARLDSAIAKPSALPRDTSLLRFRRVRVRGTPDYAHEFVEVDRTHLGSPGVFLFTPVRLPGSDTAVLVNRGWVYSPDAVSVDLARWRDPNLTVKLLGFAMPFDRGRGPATLGDSTRLLRRADSAAFAAVLPYPVLPFYVVATADSSHRRTRSEELAARTRPAQLAPPPLDDGPHLSYAIQWFAFALMALGGAGLVAWRWLKRREI